MRALWIEASWILVEHEYVARQESARSSLVKWAIGRHMLNNGVGDISHSLVSVNIVRKRTDWKEGERQGGAID